jgi:hypothetical protein
MTLKLLVRRYTVGCSSLKDMLNNYGKIIEVGGMVGFGIIAKGP